MYTYERIARTDAYRRVLPFINWLNRIKKCRVLTICMQFLHHALLYAAMETCSY
jgi:hypothetical protein